MDIAFGELAERWEKAEGVTKKSSTLIHYRNAIRMYVNPVFQSRKIATISRENIQVYLAEQAKRYSHSALRSMRTVLSMTLGWAAACGWIPNNPCLKIKLPRKAAGRRVCRIVLSAQQINSLVAKLEEPYATLVLFLSATGLRISEAIGVQWSDIDNENVLSVARRVYIGDTDTVKSLPSTRRLPMDSTLANRLRALRVKFPNGDWVFQSRAGTPINPGNVLKRYVRPATRELGISLGGYHDFRHTLTTKLRRWGAHPKVVSDILGHKNVTPCNGRL